MILGKLTSGMKASQSFERVSETQLSLRCRYTTPLLVPQWLSSNARAGIPLASRNFSAPYVVSLLRIKAQLARQQASLPSRFQG